MYRSAFFAQEAGPDMITERSLISPCFVMAIHRVSSGLSVRMFFSTNSFPVREPLAGMEPIDDPDTGPSVSFQVGS